VLPTGQFEREEQNLIKKIAIAAILTCAVMVLVAGAPLVTADTHHVLKGAQGPRASAVSWDYAPASTGTWTGHIVNSGLRSLVVDVNDITTGAASSILHQRIRFAAYPSNTLDTLGVLMAKNHLYNITVIPNGPKGTSCTIDDVLNNVPSPVAMFTWAVNGATVSVDGSGSRDPTVGQTITDWGWEWGDGMSGTGKTASHTYTTSGTYAVTLTVLSSTNMTNSTSHDVIVDFPPVASFTAIVSEYSVTVTSTSTDDHGIASWSWNWNDGSAAGTGATATHTYTAVPPLLRTIVLTVTDTVGQTNSVSNDVTLQDSAPVAAFTIAPPVGLAVSVDASASTDDHGIAIYSWNWDDSTTGTGMTASHTYGASGTYTITLTVTDTVGQTNPVSHPATVGSSVVASFTVTVSGATVSVDGSASTSSVGIASYSWNWGDSIIGPSGVTASHTYFPPGGTFTITLTVTDALGQKGTASKTVTVVNSALPPPPFLLYGNVWASDGATPVAGCMVTITDVRAGTTFIGIVSDGTGFYYVENLGPLYPLVGDTIVVNAIGPAGQTGSGTGVVGSDPYLGINVTLSG